MPAPRASRWSIRLPDLTGRRAIVTGASDGVGVEIARGLAETGAEVVLPVRNRGKGERAIARIRESAPDALVELVDLDLADLGSVLASVQSLLTQARPVHLLVLNAGMIALGDPDRHTSVDGFELHFQTNHLGHYAFTIGIMPLLQAGRARVTVQSSLAVRYAGVRFDDLQLERRYSALRAYASSKAALSLFGLELGRRSAECGWGITTNLSHPGIAITNIAPAELLESRTRFARLGRRVMDGGVGGTPAEASLSALFAVASADAAPGAFYGPGGFARLQGPPRAERLGRFLRTRQAAERIWVISEGLAATRLGGDRGDR